MLTERKKITYFSLDMNIGGVERQLYYLLKGVDYDKYQITLVLCKKEGGFLKEIPKNVIISDLLTVYSFWSKPIIFFKLFRFLLKNRSDVFVSFHSKLHGISVFACLLLRIKVLCCFPGYASKGRLNWIRKIYLGFADKLISVSNGVKQSLLQNIGVSDSRKCIVIENCIDADDIEVSGNEEVQLPFPTEGKFIIVSAGRLSKEKNFEILIKAAECLPRDCLFLILGDGDNRETLENFAKTHGVGDKVVFCGFQSNVYKFINKASVYVLCAGYKGEGLPTVLLEAMALGVPCICPDYIGRTDDVIAHNISGYVFSKGNYHALVEAINFFRDKNNHDKIKAIIRRAKSYALDHSVEKYAKQYESVFDNYLNT